MTFLTSMKNTCISCIWSVNKSMPHCDAAFYLSGRYKWRMPGHVAMSAVFRGGAGDVAALSGIALPRVTRLIRARDVH